MRRIRSSATHFIKRLGSASSGVAMVEFALASPLLLAVGLYGIESANRAITQLRISQAAIMIADNASRIGDESQLGYQRMYESDINDIFYGTHLQTGDHLNLFEHGRVILSSLETVPDSEDNSQYIHWQRCMGKKQYSPAYGEEGDGLSGGMTGMGPEGEEVMAFEGEAVMFVELSYDYQPIISDIFASDSEMSATAAFNVRNNRDLSEIYQRDPNSPDATSDCDIYDLATPGT